jgi:LacI family transcriptional regulator
LYLEEDFRCRLQGIERWAGHGIIADFDDPVTTAALEGVQLPVVAIGGSYADPSQYPANRPYVATDNYKMVKLAYDHLIEAGLQHFALFSLPESRNRWAQERERIFTGPDRRRWHHRPHLSRRGDQCAVVGCRRGTADRLGAQPAQAGGHHRRHRCAGAAVAAGLPVRRYRGARAGGLIGIDNDPLARVDAHP